MMHLGSHDVGSLAEEDIVGYLRAPDILCIFKKNIWRNPCSVGHAMPDPQITVINARKALQLLRGNGGGPGFHASSNTNTAPREKRGGGERGAI